MTAHAVEEARLDTRDRILDAAERLFRHYGYSKTTVADIARDLGMSPANVYRFFPSKSALVEAIAARMLAARRAENQKLLAMPGTAAERLKRFLVANHHITLETMFDEAKVHEMVVVAIEEQWQVIQTHIVQMTDAVEEIVRAGVASGEFRDTGNIRALARCALQAYVSMMHPQVIASCLQDVERASPEELADFVIMALKA